MKIKKKFFFSGLVALICGITTMTAQVTIGDLTEPQSFSILELISNGKMGLRLPQLTTSERNKLAVSGNDLACGLTIYNITTNCMEYWNATKWVSLCKGQAEITFTDVNGNPVDPTQSLFPPNGQERGSYTPVDESNCTKEKAAFSFITVVGNDYLTVTVLNKATGEFKVAMSENHTAAPRMAILRVTNNCTQEYKEFIFTQDNDFAGCGNTTVIPAIASENGTSLCGSGAAYLYLTGRPTQGTFIWTLDGDEVGRGTSYIATQSGNYIVYGDKIGCNTPAAKSIEVSSGTPGAPNPIAVIAVQNNGLVCSQGAETPLFATASSEGDIVWYKDGVRQASKTGMMITADIGEWFAVVENGSCSSVPSNTVTIALDPNAGQAGIAPVTITVNGKTVSSSNNNLSFCASGSLLLEVASPQANVTYKWYAGDSQSGQLLGTGSSITASIAAVQGYSIIQCVASSSNACTQSQYTQFSFNTSIPPDRPVITSPNGNSLCGGSATLTASSPGITTYEWYFGTDKLPINAQTITVYNTGTFTAYAVSGDCVSAASQPFVVSGSSNFAENVGITESGNQVGGSTINVNESTGKTFTAAISATGGETYSWTVTGNATPASGTGNSINVSFGAHSNGTTATIKVKAYNACTPAGVENTVDVNIQSNCPSVDITAYSPTTKAAEIVGSASATLSVTPNANASNFTYQWYKSDSSINGATNQSYAATSSGTYYCIITSKCNATLKKQSDNFIITQVQDPATIQAGAGTLTGRNVFDINKSNDGNGCGTKEVRKSQEVNFATLGAVPYTFTKPSSGTVTNVRYRIVDNETCVTSAKTGNLTLSGNTATISVTFKNTLSNDNGGIYGRSRNNAAKIKIYVIYTIGSQEYQNSLNIDIQDCACCGAYVAANKFKTFMCHNLGADQSAEYDKPSRAINGSYYQWGANTPARTASAADDAMPSSWSSAPSSYYGDNSGKSNITVKSPADPCPRGYRVPNADEWVYVINNNTKTNIPATWSIPGANTFQGSKFGDFLFLPAAGQREYKTGALAKRGEDGVYWTTLTDANGSGNSDYIQFSASGTLNDTFPCENSYAFPVRCIEE